MMFCTPPEGHGDLHPPMAWRSPALHSPEVGNPENAIFETKNGLLGGSLWTHLNNPAGVLNSPP